MVKLNFGANRNLDHLPGDYGLPLIGKTAPFMFKNREFLLDAHKQYGNVAKTSVLGMRLVMLMGPEANEMLFQDKNQNFSTKKGYEFVSEMFEGGILLRDFEDHRYHRKIINNAFKKSALTDYLELMNPLIQQTVNNWGNEGNFLFSPAAKQLTLNLAATVFMGADGDGFGSDKQKISQAYSDWVGAAATPVRLPIPGSPYAKGVKARDFLNDYALARVDEKRGSTSRDLFAHLCRAQSEDGKFFSNQEVARHLMFIILAAHDTTTSSLSYLVGALGIHKDWQEKVREEAFSIEHESPNYADISEFNVMDMCINEGLRKYTPVSFIIRRAEREFEYEGHTIPDNSFIACCPGSAHYSESYWTNPYTFDPNRFAPGREEDKQHPFLFTPFGGGAHMCIGKHFAYMQAKTILFHLIRNYEIVVPENYRMKMKQFPLPLPKDKLPITFKPLRKSSSVKPRKIEVDKEVAVTE